MTEQAAILACHYSKLAGKLCHDVPAFLKANSFKSLNHSKQNDQAVSEPLISKPCFVTLEGTGFLDVNDGEESVSELDGPNGGNFIWSIISCKAKSGLEANYAVETKTPLA